MKVYLPPDSDPTLITRTPPALPERILLLFFHPGPPRSSGHPSPGGGSGVVRRRRARRGTVLRIQLGFKGLDATAMLGLRDVMVSATVNSSWWGF